MNISHSNAINFSYILLEFCTKLNITSDEIVVILMIDHLKSQNNKLISANMISAKTGIEEKEVDSILVNLYKKNFIDYELNGSEPTISLGKLQKRLYEEFEKSIFSSDELEKNKEQDELRHEIYDRLEHFFKRTLSPFEVNIIDNWVSEIPNRDIIFNSIKDAEEKKIYSLTQIDKIIIKKLRTEDNQGNEI